jgi:diaminopimelate decarboxylase
VPDESVRDDRFRLDAETADRLAAEFGTPLYVISEGHFRSRIRRYRAAFEAEWPGGQVAYASKANSTLAVLAIAASEGCQIDVASEGELRAAQAAGVEPARCHFHGNNKTAEELRYALSQGIGMVVADNESELHLLHSLGIAATKLVLRLAPGVDPKTDAKISTGQADTKFGFGSGGAVAAVELCRSLGLPLIGFHCHVGSQLIDPEAQRGGAEYLARFAIEVRDRTGFTATYLNFGGGLGVRYTGIDAPLTFEEYNRIAVGAAREALAGSGLDPVLGQEPGRSLIAESAVTLYRVGVVKPVPQRTYVSVDGGLSDNPRPAMYGARYDVRALRDEAPPARFTVSGKHCETDLLFLDVELPADIRPGDLLQVLTTGAYNATMASNYNRYPRPATALLREDGSAVRVQRRETWDEMLAREELPEDLL